MIVGDFEDRMRAIQRDISINTSDIENYQCEVDDLKGQISEKEDEIWELEGELKDLEEEAAKNPALRMACEVQFHMLVANKDAGSDYGISRLPHELIRYGIDEAACVVVMKSGAVYAGSEPYPAGDDEMILVGVNEELGTESDAIQNMIEEVLEDE